MATRNPSLNNLHLKSAGSGVAEITGDDAELFGPRGEWWWTGKKPEECPGYSTADGVLKSLPMPPTKGYTRQQLLDYFDNVWAQTEVLFASLQGTDAFVRQPYHQLRHPMMFYYGHPAVLYVNKFRVGGLLDEGIDDFFEQVFETGVDEMSWDDLSRATTDWPPVRAVHAYRQTSYKLIRAVIENHPSLDHPEEDLDMMSPAWAVFMGFEHERIHLETSSVLIRELPLSSVLKPQYMPDYHPSSQLPSPAMPAEGVDHPVNSLIEVAGETVTLGKAPTFPSFGWDNEYGTKVIPIGAFKASQFKVTNGEFLSFVRDRGYSTPKYWSAEGWGWKTFRNVKWPTFWIVDGPQGLHRYKLRALFNAIDMRWDWPVDVNYHEAKAFCAWKTEKDGQNVAYRIITEGEHNLLRNTEDRVDAPQHANLPRIGADSSFKVVEGKEACYPDPAMAAGGEDIVTALGFNMQLAYSSQSPVTALPSSSKGFHDVFGNAWEWAEDHYAAFPGFKVHPFYEDFSSPCFGGKHQLILGGSFMSTGQLCSKFARFQFRPHFFQHASFRVVQQVVDVSQYNMARYGPHNPVVPYYTTSCMDCAPPHVGDGPCCSVSRRSAFTPTIEEEKQSCLAKHIHTQGVYESDALMAQYLAMHYGPAEKVYHPSLLAQGSLLQGALEYPTRTVDTLSQWCKRESLTMGRVLDLGCAVGRTCFNLASHFDAVVGVDISHRFIEVANKVKENKRIDYDMVKEGDIIERVSAALSPETDTSKVTFALGDACHLPSSYQGSFDAVLASNLLDRVPEPLQLLKQIAGALKPGGLLLLSTPHSWSDEYTAKSNWLGGGYKDGLPLASAEVLASVLAADFDVLSDEVQPMLLPEHARMYRLLLSQELVLRRK